MLYGAKVIDEVDNLYRVIKLIRFRKTDKVTFDMVSADLIGNINAIDKVIHRQGACSPGSVESIARPWYMHPFQEDNLLVVNGSRDIEIYTPKHNKVEHFSVYPEQILKNGELLAEGTCIINWPRGVFHRIISNEPEGSISLNFAVCHAGFDINSNFNVYDLDTDNGQYRLLREGSKDQDIQEGF